MQVWGLLFSGSKLTLNHQFVQFRWSRVNARWNRASLCPCKNNHQFVHRWSRVNARSVQVYVRAKICPDPRKWGLRCVTSKKLFAMGNGGFTVHSSLDQAVRLRALAGVIVLCSWVRQLNPYYFTFHDPQGDNRLETPTKHSPSSTLIADFN